MIWLSMIAHSLRCLTTNILLLSECRSEREGFLQVVPVSNNKARFYFSLPLLSVLSPCVC